MKSENFANTTTLFSEEEDGFTLQAGRVPLTDSITNSGEFSWAILQQNTKAQIAIPISQPEQIADTNDKLQSQPRPSLSMSEFLHEPTNEKAWNEEVSKLLSLRQLELSKNIWKNDPSNQIGEHFTTRSLGLLTDVVKGGLKADLSLGFEMNESDFTSSQLQAGKESIANPFHSDSETKFETPRSYQNQRSLYQPMGPNDEVYFRLPMPDSQNRHHTELQFPVYTTPTFHTLRSFYRTYHHVFNRDGNPTIFERASDHIAATQSGPSAGFVLPPSRVMDGLTTQTSFRPVMDRNIFLVSLVLSESNRVGYMFTPVVTLWNPYNVALEIEGAVTYNWGGFPFKVLFTKTVRGREQPGQQFNSSEMGPLGGGSPVPIFCGAITATGAPLQNSGNNPTIHFEPGEVRLFAPTDNTRYKFNKHSDLRARTIFLKPVEDIDDFNLEGGIFQEKSITLSSLDEMEMEFFPSQVKDHPFFLTLEDATRAKGTSPNGGLNATDGGKAIAEVLSRHFSQSGEGANFKSPKLSYNALKLKPYTVGLLESYHRVGQAGGDLQSADIAYTSNPRQPWMNEWISNRRPQSNSTTGPQYQMRMKELQGNFNNFLQTDLSGRRTFYGPSNNANTRRTHLSFFEAPTTPMLSLAGFQHADLSTSSFAPAYQLGNSWASAYVETNQVTSTSSSQHGVIQVDHCYLANEALWDGFFFSGAAPTTTMGSLSDATEAWNSPIANQVSTLEETVKNFIESPEKHPLRNPRMKLYLGKADPTELAKKILEPGGTSLIAGNLMFDGAFNVNSTSTEAWAAILASLRNAEFETTDGKTAQASGSLLARMKHPTGTENDNWNGYRALTKVEILDLAESIVEEVKLRGPFLSLAEFINRRVSSSPLGHEGALQAAIDATAINHQASQGTLSKSDYLRSTQQHLSPADIGVGIPGYLTQADILQSLGPSLTVRSDTFIIRSYGSAFSKDGRVIAETWLAAEVQRIPDFIDSSQTAATPIAELNETNRQFGRRFVVRSVKELSRAELGL